MCAAVYSAVCRTGWIGAVYAGTAPVDLAQAQEVVRVGSEACGQQAQELLLIESREEWVRGALAAYGRRAFAAPWGGAERPGAVGGIDRQLVRQTQDPLAKRAVQAPPQRLGLLGADEVGAGHGADQQGPAAEQGHRSAPVEEQVGKVLRGVAGGADGSEREPVQVGLLIVLEAAIREGQFGRAGSQDLASQGGQLATAGDEV